MAGFNDLSWRKASSSGDTANCVEYVDLDLADLAWLKASGCDSSACVEQADLVYHKSSASAGNCVEVAAAGKLSAIRDSKDPDGAVLVVGRSVFNALLTDCKAGRLDL